MDALDAIMAVMEAAFDPAFGEAWNRRQVGDALVQPNTHLLLADATGQDPRAAEEAVGFTLSRQIGPEEELLLIAVMPAARGNGVGGALLARFIAAAQSRGANRLFLEMRDGNPAQALYLRHGFVAVGRRPNYYRAGTSGPLDAITYLRDSLLK
ncbi:GNAT family N-acetyltransferase [Alteraurantiacibacter palmitatis]|uniref:GNAT family N-acetyltransferase n=1 Tax=Alteraurantiacibacter palmitatis TaxID=2054628 RepID=A0ABV7E3Y1_9SPHN